MDGFHYKITDNVNLLVGNANTIVKEMKGTIDFIYMDPPYDTNRNFTLDSKSNDTGFTDKWGPNEYEKWLSDFIEELKKTLTKKGTLVLHISSENSFIIEKILRDKFKNVEKIYWKHYYPRTLDSYNKNDLNGLDPLLVESLIRAESRYHTQAKSYVGAVGLMQIMPYTAFKISGRLQDYNFRFENLWHLEKNLSYGLWYLANLLSYYKNN